ncbi:GPALPP motifs-containing protein 1 [Aspergillus lucknowensis]|uniref:DUF3752 domain-containing protein n=1 Tax=Aspergillus lucknowensis TaxID=176173 RepID=A0ABR4L5X7_9EURO
MDSKRTLSAVTGPEPSSPEPRTTPGKRRKVIGPSLPPPPHAQADKQSDVSDSNSDSDSSDDDNFGPSLPPQEGSVSIPQPPPQQPINTSGEQDRQHQDKSAPQRDAWMLAPPTADSRSSRVDPTKLRNRKFQSGPRVMGNTAGAGVDSSWTETPEEKIRRLQNEAMGIVSSSSGTGVGPTGAGTGPEEKKAQAMREKVQKYNERMRKDESLAEKKKKEKEKDEEDDPSKRAFDKEKDMALSSRITHAQRREMINKASDFGSRFSKGKFL